MEVDCHSVHLVLILSLLSYILLTLESFVFSQDYYSGGGILCKSRCLSKSHYTTSLILNFHSRLVSNSNCILGLLLKAKWLIGTSGDYYVSFFIDVLTEFDGLVVILHYLLP